MDSTRFEQYAQVAGIALLVIGCFLVIRPFLAALLFAAVLCLSTWPAFRWLKDRLGGRSTLAALLFALGMLLAIALPVALAAYSLITHSAQAIDIVRGFLDRGSVELPCLDHRNAARRAPGSTSTGTGSSAAARRSSLSASAWPSRQRACCSLPGHRPAKALLQILLAIFVAFFFYRDGENVALMIRTGMTRLAGGDRGASVLATAQNAVKGVVYGLIGTAIAQAAVALVGFLIAGVPAALLLAALTFVLSLVPMGPVCHLGRRGSVALLSGRDRVGGVHGRSMARWSSARSTTS